MSGSPAPLARDFLETRDGLFFAVVANGTERVPGPTGVEDPVALTFLRYVRDGDQLRKVDTGEASERIRLAHPEYLFYSALRDVTLHGVPLSRIHRHHQPRVRAAELTASRHLDPVERTAVRVLSLFDRAGLLPSSCGVTGSVLLGAHTAQSDIDLVIYDRDDFHRARQTVRDLTGKGELEPLDDRMWKEAFDRRACSLSFEEYLWHEQRKHNKLVVGGRKVDVSLVTQEAASGAMRWRKLARLEIRASVVDDHAAFDFPARFEVDHPEVSEVVSFTNTFTGQAQRGETILAAGWQEESDAGNRRLLVGTSREAAGEFIRVVRE